MSERYIPEHRRTQFKAKGSFKPEELRRRREEQQVEIRKAKRDENLAKRRGLTTDFASRPGAALGAAPDSDDDTAPTESQVRTTQAASQLQLTKLPPFHHSFLKHLEQKAAWENCCHSICFVYFSVTPLWSDDFP